MPAAGSQDRVTRLVEMIVEEVSIVDRAANKHRFLIVKRSEGMEDTTTGADPTETDLNAPGPPDDGGGEATPPDTGDRDTGGAPQGDDDLGALVATVAALEGLTEAVELLATQGDETAGPRLAELASELQTAAETLAAAVGAQDGSSAERAGSSGGAGIAGAESAVSAAGASSSDRPADTDRNPGNATGSTGGPPADKPDTAGSAPPDAEPDRLETAVAAIRVALGQVSAALATPRPSRTAKAAPGGGSDGAPGGASGGAASAKPAQQIAEQLAQVVSALQALTGTVKEQQQRLARLEKRSGLPNSQPGSERAPAPGNPTGSWPLDLNQPVDRDSVDKAVSFHDVSA